MQNHERHRATSKPSSECMPELMHNHERQPRESYKGDDENELKETLHVRDAVSSLGLCRHYRTSLHHNSLGDFLAQLRLFHERLFRGVLPLADQFAIELQPRALLLHHPARDAHVNDASFLVNSLVVHDVELRLG